eukprot:TRINITY_DN8045_c0_g1_i4.p2 TRINITY_DN8045_c0_g1~~TRINITY_DN8045_c0_g1_i4.p2  ORF type:complete len:130 (+),score=8.32 TRINITY_DN8045_c0_g1_i4:546-935(+)
MMFLVHSWNCSFFLHRLTTNIDSGVGPSQAEKTELRDEKARLKAERERLQLQLQAISMPTAGYAVPSALPAAPATPLHVSMQAGFANPLAVKAGFPGMDASQAPMALWQWMPTVRADMASDHLLRPPVA